MQDGDETMPMHEIGDEEVDARNTTRRDLLQTVGMTALGLIAASFIPEDAHARGSQPRIGMHIPIGMAAFQVDGYATVANVLPSDQVQQDRFGIIVIAIDDVFSKGEAVALSYKPDILRDGKGGDAPRSATILPNTPFAYARFRAPLGPPEPIVTVTVTFRNNQINGDITLVAGQEGVVNVAAKKLRKRRR